MALRVFIVEDDPLLRVELISSGGLEVVGTAGSGAEALTQLPATQARVALVDLGLPYMTGQELIRQLSAAPTLLMAHTVFDDCENVPEAIKAGASGYVLKGCSGDELVEALKELDAGGAPMSPHIPDPLSPRERQLLKLVDEGLTYKQISERLHVSTHTVHSHIKNIYEALHAKSRGEALATARARGLI